MTTFGRRNDVSDRGPAPPGEVRRWRAFALLAVAFFMTNVDLTIVNVALPTIGRKLHFPESDLQWVVTAYALTYGGFLLLGGRAADLLGRRRLFMAGLAIFTAASLACALAPSDTFLIIMRGIQGLGAAVVLPAALSYLKGLGPALTPEQAGKAIAGLASGPGRDQDAYLLTAAGLSPVQH
jgi:MFS family permease